MLRLVKKQQTRTMELFHSANVDDVSSLCGNFGAGRGENCRFMADLGENVKDVLTVAEAAADKQARALRH